MSTRTTKSRMSIILPKFLIKEVEKASKALHRPKSAIIEFALQHWLNMKLDNDSKELANLNFEDLPTEDDWLLLQHNTS